MKYNFSQILFRQKNSWIMKTRRVFYACFMMVSCAFSRAIFSKEQGLLGFKDIDQPAAFLYPAYSYHTIRTRRAFPVEFFEGWSSSGWLVYKVFLCEFNWVVLFRVFFFCFCATYLCVDFLFRLFPGRHSCV